MKKIYIPFLLLISQFYCYSQQKPVIKSNVDELTIEVPEKGTIENDIYKCNLFDWKIEIPSGFTVIPDERIKQLQDKGYQAIQENATEGKNIRRETNNLISFEKNKYNIFGATYESLEGTKKLSLEEHKQFTSKLLEETYSGKGIKVDIVSSDLKLGEHDFYKIVIHLYHPKTNQLILTQEFYTTYINNHLFSANMNYTDENSGYVMAYNFIKSFK
jgi:hypothetical protein